MESLDGWNDLLPWDEDFVWPRHAQGKVAGVAVLTLGFIFLGKIFSLFLGNENCEGTPLFLVYLNVAVQSFLLIPLSSYAFYDSGWNWDFLFEDIHHNTHWAIHFELYTILAYCLKDFLWINEPMLIAHHIAAVVGTINYMVTELPGTPLFCLATSLLEYGSLWTNIVFMHPKNKFLVYMCTVMMSISNIGVLPCLAAFTWHAPKDGLNGWNVFYTFACTVTMTYFRQSATMGYISTYNKHGTLLPNASKGKEELEAKKRA
eukprot:Hpha_TRINITY_DN15664_c3_g5::TRINITY_DN15664_c3_g5_i1::g.101931::m.101931